MKESKEYPGYFVVPELSGRNDKKLLINRDGVLRKADDGFVYKSYQTNWGYLVAGGYAIHNLLALTFLEPSENPEATVVNHKDGDKTNNDIDNLEWTTYSGNAEHAYATGLRSDNTPVLSRNESTEEIIHHYSMQECARYIGVNAAYVYRWVRAQGSVNTPKGEYTFIYADSEWPVKKDQGFSNQVKPLIGERLSDGKLFLFDSLVDAAYYADCNYRNLVAQLSRYPDSPYKGWIYRRYDDPRFDKLREAATQVKREKKSWQRTVRKPIPVRVTFNDTGVTREYESAEILASELGVSKNTLQKGVYVGNGTWRNLTLTYLR